MITTSYSDDGNDNCHEFLGLVYTLNLNQMNLILIKFVNQSTISPRLI